MIPAEQQPSPRPPRVVLCPDLVLEGLLDEETHGVLRWWRDGVIRPVVCPPLLVRYLRALRGLGLTDELLRRWAWWFGSPDKCELVETDASSPRNAWAICHETAVKGQARWIVHGSRSSPPPSILASSLPGCIRGTDFLRAGTPAGAALENR